MKPAPPRIAERPDIAGPIIDKFGGDARCAELTGYPASTIKGWRAVGNIHDKYRPWLLHVARENGIAHTPWDYIAHLAPYSIAA